MILAAAPRVDISAHADMVTGLLLGVCGLLVAFFALRPELWRRMFLTRVDPRPAALLRIVFGTVVLWTFLDLLPLARTLFTDEGMFMTDMSRKNYGGRLKVLWDPEHGFEHWYGPFQVLWSRGSILQLRSDPAFVYTIYGITLTNIVMVILGIKTRITTILTWFLVEQIYRYNPIFYTGGDTVTRVFLFLSMFCRWGEAYSLDSWWRRRKAVLAGATRIPPLRRIAAWPQRLMMLQLTIIYCATGVLKSGPTWADGTALYYALNLDHFYRFPMTGVVAWLQYVGVLRTLTWLVHWWEILFPLALIGIAINAYEGDRRAGTWIPAHRSRRWASYVVVAAIWAIAAYVSGLAARYYLLPEYLPFRARPGQIANTVAIVVALLPVVSIVLYLGLRRFSPLVFDFIRLWLMGKRWWLIVGLGMHLGIDFSMNVGTFAQVMMAVYFAWLSGPEVEAGWRFLLSRPLAPGEGDRPVRRGWARAVAPLDRIGFRTRGRRYTIHHAMDEPSVRRAALLRVWDLGHRLGFVADDTLAPGALSLDIEGAPGRVTGPSVGRRLIRIFPGLWWLFPFSRVPGVGALVLRLTR